MEDVPLLTANDLRAELDEAYRGRRQHHLFAFFGAGDLGEITVGDAPVRVVPVRSEIELREKMPALTDDEVVRVAFLVPWTHDIPLDLAGRFALHGRVRKIGKESRLRALFGVSQVDDDARRSALATYLLAAPGERRYALSGSRLTAEAMWSAWLSGDWGLDTEGRLGLDMLLAFVAADGRGASFAEAMARPEAGATREALLAWLDQTVGPCGSVLWRAWEEGRGRRAMELALVCEPLVKGPHAAVRMWVKTKVREQLAVEKDVDVIAVAEALAREAASAFRILERQLPAAQMRALAKAADALVDDDEVRASLVESARLPSAWVQRLDALGTALAAGAASPTEDATKEALGALRALESHAFFKDADQEHVLRRAEMAVRLLAWLVARPDRKLEAGHTPYGDAEVLGRWYVTEGGYVDRARHGARGVETGLFGEGVKAVLAAADAARTELDARFARGLVGWVEAGQPATQVLPIHDAVRRVAVRFLEGDDKRRLLVLLLDGMAWAQASELLESLGRRAAAWGPLTWHAQKEGRIGESPLPVVFAGFPTVTEVSRSAFFAGTVLGPGAKLTTPDPDHWARHAQVKKLVPPADVPRLLLRGEGHTKAGGASEEALSLVADTERRIVALVLNAIDDSLKASHAVRHPWGVDNIASLPDLLDKAREAGRAVLLASDHGHVPVDRLQYLKPMSTPAASRWRPWPAAGAAVLPNEVAFSGPRVYAPPGAHGVVLLADDASSYSGGSHAGEHGGATLAEVVAPCVLIGCEDGPGVDDEAQRPSGAAQEPPWWHFDVSERLAVDHEAPVQKPSKPEAQMVLPVIAPPPVETVKVISLAVAGSAFAGSAVLKSQASTASARQEVVRAVDILLERGCVMSSDAFAAAMDLAGWRAAGLISKLQEVLNLDGYEVLRHDAGARQVFLDRDKLAQLFEVTL
jgi:hypothetical protein